MMPARQLGQAAARRPQTLPLAGLRPQHLPLQAAQMVTWAAPQVETVAQVPAPHGLRWARG